MLTKQWCIDKARNVARDRIGYEKLFPKQIKAVEAVFLHFPAGYRKSFYHSYLPSYSTICTGHGNVYNYVLPDSFLNMMKNYAEAVYIG